jgi:hypothetical protein
VASLLDYLQDIFLALFIRDPQAVEKRKQLRSLYEKIRRVHPMYYRRATGQVLPQFAEAIEQLAGLLRPLREIFDKTLGHEDAKLAQRYADFMLVSRLPGHLQETYTALGFSSLRQRILSAPDPPGELAAVEGKVQELLQYLSGAELQGFEQEYTATQRLVSLCRHDLSHLLSLFGPRSADARTSYQPAVGEELLQELLDLYFILSGLELSPGVERNIGSLLERLARERAEEARKKLRTVFQKLYLLLDEHLRAGTVLVLIRLIQRDPHYVPQIMREEGPAIESFRNRWLITFQRSRDRVRWLLRENEVSEDLKALFAGADLLEIEGYPEGIDQALQQRELEGFVHFRPLRIMKSYILMHFERELRDLVKRLIVEGKFENRIFQNMLTNTFFGCEGVRDRIHEFEQALQSDGPQSARRLPKYLELLGQGKPVQSMLSTVLEGIESSSRRLVEEGANLFYNLCVILLEILNDARQKTPVQISNIKSLGGRRYPELLARLSSGYNNLFLFTRIMKNFTTIQQMSMSEAKPAY